MYNPSFTVGWWWFRFCEKEWLESSLESWLIFQFRGGKWWLLKGRLPISFLQITFGCVSKRGMQIGWLEGANAAKQRILGEKLFETILQRSIYCCNEDDVIPHYKLCNFRGVERPNQTLLRFVLKTTCNGDGLVIWLYPHTCVCIYLYRYVYFYRYAYL